MSPTTHMLAHLEMVLMDGWSAVLTVSGLVFF